MFGFQLLRKGLLQRLGRDAGRVGDGCGLGVGFRRGWRGAAAAHAGGAVGFGFEGGGRGEPEQSLSLVGYGAVETEDAVEALH